jgi:outer membrane protein OmpA-like peptidoglycan-associated protein
MKANLAILAKRLARGYSITVTGYANGNAGLAKRRAEVVAKFLSTRVKTHVTIKVVTNTNVSKVTVATTRT